MFITCWLVQFLGVDIAFTKWGLLSGLLWVLGGTCGIYGIRNAGLAIAVGTWASIMVMINFFFGILIFHEPVADIWGTLGAFLLLIVGLVGMSIYSAPIPKAEEDTNDMLAAEVDDDQDQATVDDESLQSPYQQYQESQVRQRIGPAVVEPEVEMEGVPNDDDDTENPPASQPFVSSSTIDNSDLTAPHIVLLNGRISLTKRQCGIIGAAMNGVLTGSSLLPVHYAEEEGFGGARYFPSMACGALLANVCLWCLFFGLHAMKELQKGNSIQQSILQYAQTILSRTVVTRPTCWIIIIVGNVYKYYFCDVFRSGCW